MGVVVVRRGRTSPDAQVCWGAVPGKCTREAAGPGGLRNKGEPPLSTGSPRLDQLCQPRMGSAGVTCPARDPREPGAGPTHQHTSSCPTLAPWPFPTLLQLQAQLPHVPVLRLHSAYVPSFSPQTQNTQATSPSTAHRPYHHPACTQQPICPFSSLTLMPYQSHT